MQDDELTPGMPFSISKATRKGSTLPSTSLSMRTMAASWASMIQMQLQHKAMMICHPAAQRRFQLRRGGVNPPICKCG
jgi:hypothetical protein